MKILIAPDSFKESLSAKEVACAIEQGIRRVFPKARILKVPMADGGEGTVRALVSAAGGRILKRSVYGPLGKRVEAEFGILGDKKTGVIEMASASGLALIKPESRNPLKTTTYGTGELIKAALNKNLKKIIIGLGGSATVDGGSGMARALGFKFLDSRGKVINPLNGAALEKIYSIDAQSIDLRVKQTEFIGACDVDNPLLGPEGAAKVYGPQKGATPEMVKKLEKGLRNLAKVIKRDLGPDVTGLSRPCAQGRGVPGAGAAGGLGAGLAGFLNAKLKPGIDIVIDLTGLKKKIKGSHLVITGEGKLDSQTIYGKVPIGVAKTAKLHNVPVIAVCGSFSKDANVLFDYGIDAMFSTLSSVSTLREAIKDARTSIIVTVENIMRLVKIGEKIPV